MEPRHLWFGLAASGFAWFGLGVAEMFLTWRACLHNEEFGNASSHPASMIAAWVVTAFLIGVAAAAGFISYRNWRELSAQKHLIEAEGRDRKEFMALLGVFVSFTLGMGMVWMGIPLIIIRLCARTR